MMPKIDSKSHCTHVLETIPVKQKRRKPQESIGVVPAKNPPKIKLENLCNSRVPKLGENYAQLGLRGFWGFYSSIRLTLVPWPKRRFLVGEILFNSRILQNSFHIGVFLTRVFHRVQDILIRGAQVRDMMDPLGIPFTRVNFVPSICNSVYAF